MYKNPVAVLFWMVTDFFLSKNERLVAVAIATSDTKFKHDAQQIYVWGVSAHSDVIREQFHHFFKVM